MMFRWILSTLLFCYWGQCHDAVAHEGGWRFSGGHLKRLAYFNKEKPGYDMALKEVRPSLRKDDLRLARASGWSVAGNYHFGLEKTQSLDLFEGSMTSGVITSHGNLYFGTDKGVFYCIREETQALQWSYDMKTVSVADPITRYDLIYVAGMDGILRALSKHDGSLKWQAEFKAPLRASPLCFWKYLVQVDQEGNLSVFLIKDGEHKELWSTKLAAGVVSTPLSNGGRIFVATKAGHLYCFELHSGKALWQKSLNGGVSGALALHKSSELSPSWLVVGTDLGQLHWMSMGGTEWGASPLQLDSKVMGVVVGGGQLYVSTLRSFYQIDPYHGQKQVEFLLPQGEFSRSPIFDGENLWLHSVIKEKGEVVEDGADYGFALKLNGTPLKSKGKTQFPLSDLSMDKISVDGRLKEWLGPVHWERIHRHSNGVVAALPSRFAMVQNGDGMAMALETPIQKLGWKRREKRTWRLQLHMLGNGIDDRLRVVYDGNQVKAHIPKLQDAHQDAQGASNLRCVWKKKNWGGKEVFELWVEWPKYWRGKVDKLDQSMEIYIDREQVGEGQGPFPRCRHGVHGRKVLWP